MSLLAGTLETEDNSNSKIKNQHILNEYFALEE